MRHLILIILVLFFVLTFPISCSTTTTTNTQSEPAEDLKTSQDLFEPAEDVEAPQVLYEPTEDVETPQVLYEPTEDVETPQVLYEPTEDVEIPQVLYEYTEDVETPKVLYDSKFYKEIFNLEDLPEECLLQEGKEPIVFYSDDIDSDINELKSSYYFIIGFYGYNGPANPLIEELFRSLCIDKKAAVGVYTFEEADTRTGAYNSYSIKRYDYYGYLFVPMNLDMIAYNYRIGILAYNLSASEKIATKRNTGAVIGIIYYGSPAYYSDLFKGDVITEVNGITITNADQLNLLLDSYDSTQEIEITYYRDGVSHKTSLTPRY